MIDNREVRLRKPEERDLDLALAWIKNEDHYFAGEDLPLSPEDLREMMRGEIKAPSGYDSNIYRTMETKEGPATVVVGAYKAADLACKLTGSPYGTDCYTFNDTAAGRKTPF